MHIFTFWYVQGPGWFWQSFIHVLQNFEGTIAVQDTAHNLTKPLFQDYTLQGRFIGVLFRLVRICLGSLFYFCLATLYLAVFLIWVGFPLICLASLIGSIFGPSGAVPVDTLG